VRRLVGATSDITEQRQRHHELQSVKAEAAAARRQEAAPENSAALNEERFALALEALNENVFDWNIRDDTLYFTPTQLALFGIPSRPHITAEEWAALIHPDDKPGHTRAMVTHLRGETPRFECDFRYRTDTATGAGRASTALRCSMPKAAPTAWWAPPPTSPRPSSASASCTSPRRKPPPPIATSSTCMSRCTPCSTT
jgi:PAS domain-containing protein